MNKLIILLVAIGFSTVCLADEHTPSENTTPTTTTEAATKPTSQKTTTKKVVEKVSAKKNTTSSTVDAKPSSEATKENESN